MEGIFLINPKVLSLISVRHLSSISRKWNTSFLCSFLPSCSKCLACGKISKLECVIHLISIEISQLLKILCSSSLSKSLWLIQRSLHLFWFVHQVNGFWGKIDEIICLVGELKEVDFVSEKAWKDVSSKLESKVKKTQWPNEFLQDYSSSNWLNKFRRLFITYPSSVYVEWLPA